MGPSLASTGGASEKPPVVLFEVTALGAIRRSSRSRRIEWLEVPPEVRDVIDQLRTNGVRVGVVTTGDEEDPSRLVEESALAPLFDRDLVFGPAATSDDLFADVAAQAGGASPGRCLIVASDRNDRSRAMQEGLSASPHPRLAWPVLQGMRLRYVRMTVPPAHARENWRPAVLALPFVPIRVVGEQAQTVYAIATNGASSHLDDLGFLVERLGAEDDPLVTDVYLLRDDRQAASGFLAPEGSSAARFGDDAEARSVLASSEEGLYVAVPAGRSVESYHFDQALHGHTERLAPDVSLLDPVALPEPAALVGAEEEPGLDQDEKRMIAELTPETVAADLARYAGTAPLNPAASLTIRSRHVFHAHNSMATDALAEDLEVIGGGRLEVRLHPFRHENRLLHNVEATLAGETDEVVLVTAHMDSTAAFSPDYQAPRDDAPGADDDASGTVAVLNVARCVHRLAELEAPRRTLRFVLFNAEEHGLVGSKAYAREQAAVGAPILAVFQMDMVGYNRQPPRTFEVHAGFLGSSEVEERSLALARRVGRMANEVSPGLEPPQIYSSSGPQDRDPADGRSDHSSFQQVGYPACAVTEDFFAGPVGAPEAEPNPNYHMTSDTFVDERYAAEIARAVAAAAWVTATM